jgi:hypothetical protein
MASSSSTANARPAGISSHRQENQMPKSSKVHKLYEDLLREGHSKESAARIAQSQTGQALATGKKPKHKK